LNLDRLGRLYGRLLLALSIGGFSRILVDLVDLAVDFSVRVSVDCIPVGFWLVGRTHFDTVIPPFDVCCSVDDLDSIRLLIGAMVRYTYELPVDFW